MEARDCCGFLFHFVEIGRYKCVHLLLIFIIFDANNLANLKILQTRSFCEALMKML